MTQVAPTAPAGAVSRAGRRPAALTGGVDRARQRYGWMFVTPFTLVFVTFLIVPLAYAFWMSLHTKTLAQGESFSGFANYSRAFTDPDFLHGVGFVLRFSLVLIPLQMLVSLAAALVLDNLSTRFSKFSRLMIFVPYAIPVVIGAMMWGFLYSPRFGPLGQLFGLFGADAPFLLSPDNVFYGLLNVVVWQWAGYYMIIIYAALRGIDSSIYEAARMDGANGWQIALRIKVPMISSALVLILVFALIGTLQFFTEPQVLRSVASGSIDASFTPNLYAYTLAFSYSQFNYASAISFALGVVVFIGSYVFLFLSRKRNGLS
ncbi:carbohydrate ABC transporter permease [Pengzhenrongella sicca]|uniref:Sugar ABC transporter permease n=1 Tax=Pengzhenrongella sicca TaxID=2819238 RepID=A0A8A4ZF37_9MICO|nr:sugar ABC transporter permease [Pengzhenrongella sicca]QTE29156.1 sugar ABC transporter permease [Pengzhenrongella sicca]